MLEWIENTINSVGYWGIALLMFLENLFPPIPSELIMPLAGYVAGKPGSQLNFGGVFAAGLLGSVVGALVWYYPGKFLGQRRLEAWADKYGKWLTISSEDIVKAKRWFDQQGTKAVLIGRLIPGVRTLISVPAGFSRMRVLPFLIYSTLGSAIWVGLLTYSGYVLGENYKVVEKYVDPIAKIVLGGLIMAFFIWVIKRKGNKTTIR